MEVKSMKQRISNFLLLQSSGFSRYFQTMNVLFFPFLCVSLEFRISNISRWLEDTLIPWPLLVNSPGFMIQILPGLSLYAAKNAWYCGSFWELLMWKVRGRQANTSRFRDSQYDRILQNRAFLVPRLKLLATWLWHLVFYGSESLTTFNLRTFVTEINLLRVLLRKGRTSTQSAAVSTRRQSIEFLLVGREGQDYFVDSNSGFMMGSRVSLPVLPSIFMNPRFLS